MLLPSFTLTTEFDVSDWKISVSGWFNQNNDSSVQTLESSAVRLSAGGTSQRSDPVMVIRRVDGKVVTAVFHSSLPFSTGVYWRKTATPSINVIIVCNWQ